MMLRFVFFAYLQLASLLFVLAYTSDVNKDFEAWFARRGGKALGVGVGEFSGLGRGVLALTNLSAGAEVLRVPMALTISTKSMAASEDELHVALTSAFANNDEQAVVACVLLEKARGSTSSFYEYMNVLPSYVPNLLYFPAQSLAALQEPEFERNALEAQKQLLIDHKTFLAAVQSFWPKELAQIGVDDYRWAASIVDSRGFRFRGKVFLVPFADMFNYAPHEKHREADSGEFFLTHHRLNDDDLVILADRDQEANTQLCEDYGDNKDNIYLQYHGFVADVNPFRCVHLSAPPLADLAAANRALARSLRFSQAPAQCVMSSSSIDMGLVIYFIVSVFTAEEADACAAIVTAPSKKTSWTEISEQCDFARVTKLLLNDASTAKELLANARDVSLEARTQRAIVRWLKSSLAERLKLTSIEEDEEIIAMLAGVEPLTREQEHKLLAVKFRLAAKRVLVEIVEKYTTIAPSTTKAKLQRAENAPQQTTDAASLQLTTRLTNFNAWFASTMPSANKLEATLIPGFRIGTVATSAIREGEKYLGVPLAAIMDGNAALVHEQVGLLLHKLQTKYDGNRDDFHELAFFLLHEYFVAKEDSFYWPYLALLPTPEELDIPLFWQSDEHVKSRLSPSHLVSMVMDYRAKTKNVFDKVMSLEEVVDFFSTSARSHVFTYPHYMWATAILDSRSIWWEGKRHLVPMLDFVNCAEGPDASKVHSTQLDEHSGLFADTKASWSFADREQVFENYGQANYIYFMYHGFSLPLKKNTHDCVQHDFVITKEEGAVVRWEKAKQIAQRLGFRQKAFLAACLAEPMPESVWLFLSLKMNTFEDLESRGQLGQATPEAARFLVNILDQRLRSYANHTTDHGPSTAFLATEQFTLSTLRASLHEYGEKDEL